MSRKTALIIGAWIATQAAPAAACVCRPSGATPLDLATYVVDARVAAVDLSEDLFRRHQVTLRVDRALRGHAPGTLVIAVDTESSCGFPWEPELGERVIFIGDDPFVFACSANLIPEREYPQWYERTLEELGVAPPRGRTRGCGRCVAGPGSGSGGWMVLIVSPLLALCRRRRP